MAKRTQKRKGLNREQLWKIWTKISPTNWLEIVHSFKPQLGFTFVSPGVLKGLCPNPKHVETSASFYANVGRGYCNCYGCDLYTHDPLVFVALLMDATDSEALQYLQENYKFPFLSKVATQELENQRINQETKQAIYQISHNYMLDAVTDPGKCPAARQAIDWLSQERKVPLDILHALPVGILPPLADLQTILSENYLQKLAVWKQNNKEEKEPINLTEAATNYLAETMKSSRFNGSIVWPLHITPREIGRLKLRVPSNDSPKKIVIPADEFENLLGLYGLGWSGYQDFTDIQSKVSHAYLTEGEMDVMTLMARVASSGNISVPLLSVGGKGGAAHIEPILKASGIDTAYLIGDAPSKGVSGGDPVVQSWLKKMPEMHSRIFIGWDNLIPANDLDDAVIQHGENKVLDVIHTKASTNFLPVWKWATACAAKAIEEIDANDKRKRHEKAAAHGDYIRNRTDSDLYVDAISDLFGLNSNIIKREIVSNEDSEQGFIVRCTAALQDLMFVIGTQRRRDAVYLICRNKKTGRYHQFRIGDDRSISQEIATIAGSNYAFVDQYVGFPSFFTLPDDSPKEHVMPMLDNLLKFYTREAVSTLAPDAADYDISPHLRQGYHRTQLAVSGAYVEYLVCGSSIFAIERENNVTNYRKLDGPTDRGIIFDIGLEPSHRGAPWFPGGLTEKTLEQGFSVDIPDLFKSVEEYYDIGFQFKNHKTMKTYIAALPFILSVMDAFPNPLMLFISGDSSSGKSKLMSTFTGQDTSMRDLQLYHCSQYAGSYTEASIAGAGNHDRRLMALDEFESGDSKGRKSAHVMNIFELFRPMINGESVRARGIQGGAFFEVTLRLPVMFSAIVTAQKAQDINRVVHVEMEHIPNRASPNNILLEHFGKATIATMARNIATCMYPHVPKLIENYEYVSEAFYKRLNATLPQKVEERWASHLFPVLAFLKFIGYDWEAFFRDFVEQNKHEVNVLSDASMSDDLFHALMHCSVFQLDRDQAKQSLASLLASGNEASFINSCMQGVFYDEEAKVLLLLLAGIDHMIPDRFRDFAPLQLKATLRRYSRTLSDPEVIRSKILTKAIPYFGKKIEAKHVVAINIAADVSSPRDRAETTLAQPPDQTPSEEQLNGKQRQKDPSDFGWVDDK